MLSRANLEALVDKARGAGFPVVWVQHSDDELKYGSDSWKLAQNFVPTTSEKVIHKRFNSSFADTELDQTLKALGVSRIVLAGAATNWCIRSTAYTAIDLGYNLVQVSVPHVRTEVLTAAEIDFQEEGAGDLHQQ